jgi:Helix-turn-helix family
VITTPGRRLRELIEPVAGSIFQAPEARQAAKDLGLRGWQWYFASRGAALGTAAPPVASAAFGSWAPALVEKSVTDAWAVTDPETVAGIRDAVAAASCARLFASIDRRRVDRATELMTRATASVNGEGRALFRGWRGRPPASDPFAAVWRAADLIRERRGDDNTIAWVSEGWRSPDIIIVTELWRGGDARQRATFQGWTEAEVDEAYQRLGEAKLVDGDALTDAGVDTREGIEATTDRLARPMIDALGPDHDELVGLLEELGGAVGSSS